jgi:hypothetical protein
MLESYIKRFLFNKTGKFAIVTPANSQKNI